MSLRRPGGMLRTFADRSPTGSELGPWGGKPMSERPARHSGLIPIALLAVTVLIAGACGGSAASTGPSADASAAAPPTSGASQPAVEPSATGGGIVTIAFESDIQYFDPALAYDTVSAAAQRLLFDQLVMYDEDFRKVLAVTQRLVKDANAKGVFVVDRNGQMISEAGEMRGIDTTSLASLTAGSVAATGGLAKIVGEEEFPVHFHQGQRDNLHITLIAGRIILVVVFDDRSSLGLVRLRVKKAGAQLAKVFEDIQKKAEQSQATGGGQTPFAEITDEDIDNLFSV